MAGAATALAKLGIGTTDPVDTGIAFMDFDPGVSRDLRDTSGTRGTFFSDGNRHVITRNGVEPRLSLEPSTTELVYLLPWILGGTPTGTTTKTFPWSNTAATRNLHFKPNAGEEWFLSDVGVDTATLRASTGEPLALDLECLGRTYDDTRSNFPALTYDITTQPWTLANLALTVGGVTRTCRDFSCSIRNGLDRTRYLNSLNLTTVQKLAPDGVYSFAIDVPSGDNGSSFWTVGATGAALVATFTNPVTSAVLTMSAASIRFQPRSPSWPAGGEGFLRMEGKAVRTSTADPVTFTITP